MRARHLAPLLLLAVSGGLIAAPAGTQVADPPEVGVATGPLTEEGFLPECNDAILAVETSDSLVFTRDGDLTDPLTIDYTVTGTAVPDEDYEALPGSVTFDADEDSAEVPIAILDTEGYTHRANVIATIDESDDYAIADDAGSATASFIVDHDDDAGEIDCGLLFIDDTESGIVRNVTVGQTIPRLQVGEVAPPGYTELGDGEFVAGLNAVTGGSLPPGVTLNPNGSFGGAPTAVGSYTVGIYASRPGSGGAIVSGILHINVTAGATTASTIPITGAPTRTTGLLGGLLLAAGLIALGTSLRRRLT